MQNLTSPKQMVETTQAVFNTLNDYGLQGVNVTENVYQQLFNLGYENLAFMPGATEYFTPIKEMHAKLATETFTAIRSANTQMKNFTEDLLQKSETLPQVASLFRSSSPTKVA